MSDALPAPCASMRPAADAERWSDALLEAGALSVDVSDPFAGTPAEAPIYGEPGMAPAAAWATSRVVALFAADADWRAAARRRRPSIGLAGPACTRRYPVADQDWVRSTQAQFGPIEIAPDFWIVPSWSAVAGRARRHLRLDPGLAFGTGSHPTTRMCLRGCASDLRGGESVLDYGCGSGILAIAAVEARRGAGGRASTSIRRRCARAPTTRARNARGGGASSRPDALRRRARSTWSSPTSSPTRSSSSRRRYRRARAPAGGRHRALRHPRRAGASRCRRVCTVVYTRAVARARRLGAAGRATRALTPAAAFAAMARPRRWPKNSSRAAPAARPIFRVTEPQLALRDGQVRCGHCRTVFNGREELIALDPPAVADPDAEEDELLRGPPTVTLRSAHALDPPPPPSRRRARSPPRRRRTSTTTTALSGDGGRARSRRAARPRAGRHPRAGGGAGAAGALPLAGLARRARAGDAPGFGAVVRAGRLRDPPPARRGGAFDRGIRPAGRSRPTGGSSSCPPPSATVRDTRSAIRTSSSP